MIYKFNPILKQTIWGGEKILRFKNIDSTLNSVGESWELSAVKDNESVITFGQHIGKNITQLLSEQREQLVGKTNYERFGNTFPLLIKFIDANQDLSIQVHPNDQQAERLHGTRGKTEMWYVVDTEQGAHLRSGLNQKVTPDEYEAKVNDGTITDILCDYQIASGDVFFLPAGRIHSIGKGSFIAEIQETSDITYRIFDFNRVDKNGKPRELHTAFARQVIDFNVESDYRTHYQPSLNKRVELVSCPLFTTNLFELTSSKSLSYADLDSFVIWMALGGKADCECDGIATTLNAGETILLPATSNDFKVTPHTTAKLLEIYIS